MIERLRVRIPAGAAGEFSSPELTLCADPNSVSVPPPCYHSGTLRTPVILPKVQWQVTPKHAYSLYSTMSRHSVGTYPETSSHATCQVTFGQSSQLAEPLWTDPGIKSGTSVHELISASNKQTKKRWQGMNGRTFSQKSS